LRPATVPGLVVNVVLDADRQVHSVSDNAGGVTRADVRLPIASAATGDPVDMEINGMFGVGGERAAVALNERVEIKTRFRREKESAARFNE
jgi:hypothetical protein